MYAALRRREQFLAMSRERPALLSCRLRISGSLALIGAVIAAFVAGVPAAPNRASPIAS